VNSDIELEVGLGSGPSDYVVRVVNAAAGGEPATSLRIDVDELLSKHDQLEATVLASAVTARTTIPVAEQPIHQVGRQLFEAMFTGPVHSTYRASLGVAQERGHRLRVVLRLTAPKLAALPWEMLFDPETETYLCRQEPLVRHVPAPYTPDPLAVRPPLRILGLVASPRGLPALDVDAEKQHLAEALAEPVAAGLVELVWMPEATWEDIHSQLLSGEWHVLHFIGHGDYDIRTDEGLIALMGANGRAHMVEASRLATLLGDAQPTPRLVVLNSCSSGETGVQDLFSSTAAALVRSGISAVAAMQFAISDTAAIAFARGLYTAIARGRRVDEATRSGRISILGTPGTLEWVTPVLYVRGEATRLFTFTTAPTAPPDQQEVAQPTQQVARRRAELRALYIEARDELRLAHFETAIGLLDDLLTLDPNYLGAANMRDTARRGKHLADTYTLASKAEEAGDWVAAIRAYDEILQAEPAYRDAAARREACEARQRTDLEGAQPSGQAVAVLSVAFSPDGSRLATGSGDNTARIWNSENLRMFREVTHDGPTARIWSSETGRMLREVVGHGGPVTSVAFSPDGRQLATGSDDSTARIWDIWDSKTGRQVAEFPHDSRVTSLAFSPNGRQLATGSEDGTARVWDDGFTMAVVPIPSDDRRGQLIASSRPLSDYQAITGVHVSIDDIPDAMLLSCLDPTRLEIGRRTLERLISEGRFSPEWIDATHRSVDKEVRQAGEDGRLDFSSNSRRELARLTHDGPVTSVAFSPDGHKLATASDDTARIWHGVTREDVPLPADDLKVTIVGLESRNWRAFQAITGVNLVSDIVPQAMVLLSSFDLVRREIGRSTLQKLVQQAVLGSLIGPAQIVETWERAKVEFENDRQAIEDGRFRMGNYGREPAEFAHDDLVTSVAFSPNGYKLVTGSHDGTARIWSTSNHYSAPLILTPKTQIDTVAFSPDGSWVATAGQGPSANLWKVSNGKLLQIFTHDDVATAVAFSPTEKWLAAGTRNKQAMLWDLGDLRTKKLLGRL
jgi:WD40 repeat protein